MYTKQEFIKNIRDKFPIYDDMSDDQLFDTVISKYPEYEKQIKQESLTEGGLKDFGKAILGGAENAFADIINIGADVVGSDISVKPISKTLSGESYEGGFLQRSADTIAERGQDGADALAQSAEGFQKGGLEGFKDQAMGTYQGAGAVVGGVVDIFGDTVMSGIKTIAPDNMEAKVKSEIQDKMQNTNAGQRIVSLMNEYEENMAFLQKNDPEAYRTYKASFSYLAGMAELTGVKKINGIYRSGGEIVNLPTGQLKKINTEILNKGLETITQIKDKTKTATAVTTDKINEVFGRMPKPSKEYQKAVTSNGTEFEVESTPKLFENFNDAVFSKKNEEMAVQSVFPKATKEKGINARLNSGKIALKSIEQLYDDRAKGIVTADIAQMGGGVEGVSQAMEYWGKRIGEFTDVDATLDFSKEVDVLRKTLTENFSGLDPEMKNKVANVISEFDAVGGQASIKDMQKAMSDIKSDIFSNFETTKKLASSSQGKALSKFLDSLQEKFDATIDIASGGSKELKEAKTAYSKYKKIQKDLVDSFLVAQRNAGKGLAGTAGKIGGAYELLNSPNLGGIVKGIILKQSGELISKAKSRDGNWEMLLRNLDRQSVRDYQLRIKNAESTKSGTQKNSNTGAVRNTDSTSRSDTDSSMDNGQSAELNEAEVIDFVQNFAKEIEENIGNKEMLSELKEALDDFEIPKRYKTILEDKVNSYIRDVDNYEAEVNATSFLDDNLEVTYGKDLTKAFNQLAGIQKRTKTTKGGDKMTQVEFQNSPAYKNFSKQAEEYLNSKYGDEQIDMTVQEVFEEMNDSGVRFQTKKTADGTDIDALDSANDEAMKNLKYEGSPEDLDPKKFDKYEAERDRILATKESSDTFLRDPDMPLSDGGNDTGIVARERFDIPKLKKLGQGSDRIVYELGDGKVLKISKTARGLDQTAKGMDWYLEKAGVIPETFESGKNYVVVERLKPFKELPKEDKAILKKFEADMEKVHQDYKDNFGLGEESQEILTEYNWDVIMDYDLDDFGWGDIRKANLSVKDGQPILIDEGTIGLNSTISTSRGVKNLDNPEFREIYYKSKEIKKKFGDTDKNTMFEVAGSGTEISVDEAEKLVRKYFKETEVETEFVENIFTPEGFEALGKYKDGIITFSKNPLDSTPEHEVLHAYFDLMLDQKSKRKLLQDVKAQEKMTSNIDAEEWLADNFVEFVRGREVSGIKDNVKKTLGDLSNKLKRTFFEGDTIDDMYRDLEALSKPDLDPAQKAQILAVGAIEGSEGEDIE